MEITDVKIRKLFSEGILRAVASLTFDDVFAVHDVKVLSVDGRVMVTMPNRKNRDGTFRDVAHPISPAFRKVVEEVVLAAYEEALRLAETAEETAAPASEEPPTV